MFYENADFYSTPKTFAARMGDKVDTKRVDIILFYLIN